MPFLPFPFAAYEFVVHIQGQRALMHLIGMHAANGTCHMALYLSLEESSVEDGESSIPRNQLPSLCCVQRHCTSGKPGTGAF